MLMLNLDKIEIEDIKEYSVLPIEINIPDLADKSYVEYIAAIESIIENELTNLRENTIFEINFKSKGLDVEDYKYFYRICGDILLKKLVTNERREREYRLSAKEIINLSRSDLLNCINFKTKIDCFGIKFFSDVFECDMLEDV